MSDMVMEFRKSHTVNNNGTNGGRMGTSLVLSGRRHGLFPIVSKAERISGITRYRKQFLKIKSPTDVAAQEVFVYLEYPSTAGDRFFLGMGDQADTQAELTGYSPVWLGCGKLNTNLIGGTSGSVTLQMESSDIPFPSRRLFTPFQQLHDRPDRRKRGSIPGIRSKYPVTPGGKPPRPTRSPIPGDCI